MSTQETQASGVQELIDRIRDEGVEKGREEAEGVLSEARKQAEQIVNKARDEAESIVNKAREEESRMKRSGEEALRQAGRDAVLHLREKIGEDFTDKVRRLVSHTLGDQEFLRQLILEIARKSMPEDDAGEVRIQLPAAALSEEQLRMDPEELNEGAMSQFVLGLSADVIREGLSFEVGDQDVPGVRVQLVDEDVEIELSDETISALMLQYLTPRFRALMERKD